MVGWFGAVGALDGVYVCGVDGRGEGADEDGGGGERRGDGMCVQPVLVHVSRVIGLQIRKGKAIAIILRTYFKTSEGSPGFEKTSALACVYP